MKTKLSTYIKLSVAVVALCIIAPLTSQAQGSEFSFSHSNKGKSFFTADWQIGSVSNDFVSNTSGWGANIETNHYLSERLSIGAFMSWHTNNEYIPTQTYINGTRSTTTDMFRGIYQLPFGLLVRYDFMSGKMVVPYIAAKIGANYSELSKYYSVVLITDSNWGFYASPEIGMTIFPTDNHRFGFHIGAYYGYASNSSDAWDISGLSSYGLRIGGTVKF